MTDIKEPLKYFIDLERRARYKLIKRYDKSLSYHDIKIINDILYNEKTHYVEQFKEYLIYEDYNEFLKRYYKTSELIIKLPKILNFYEKYSKIYANYTVIPESKYMYKNIKRKQKMIDQMQNNGINESEYEDYEESNEEMSNTVFSSKILNSIYKKTFTTLNKSEIGGNSEQSINDFINKIKNIENKTNNANMKNNLVKTGNKFVKSQKEMVLPMKKLPKELLMNKHTPKTTRINHNNKNENLTSKANSNNNNKNKFKDVQFTYSKKKLKNDLIKNNNINFSSNNNNAINKNNNNINNPNLIFINSYVHKSHKSNSIFHNNNSLSNTNNSNTFQTQKNSIKANIHKQKLPTALLKQNIIKGSKNVNNCKDNMCITNINSYFTNATNNIKTHQKNKLSLGEALLKSDKIVLRTKSSASPNVIKGKIFSSPNEKNFFNSKKQQMLKDKDKQKLKDHQNQHLSSNKIINTKKIKSYLLGNYNSSGNSITFLSNNFLDDQKLKNINKLNRKKANKKSNDIKNKINNNNGNNTNNINNTNKDKDKDKDKDFHEKEKEKYVCQDIQNNNKLKKPENHRNYGHSKILSQDISKTNSKINNNSNNKNVKITVGLKQDLKNNSQKVISSPCSLSNSSTNLFYQSNLPNYKEKNNANSINNNLEVPITKTLDEYNKKKVVHNYNIVNNIHDNSTQINIYTGNDLYKSLHFQNNSVFIASGNACSKSPMAEAEIKNKQNIGQAISMNNANNASFKSNMKGKEKRAGYNLNLKKIIHKQILEGDKAIITERQITRRKLFEKLGKYFFKNKNNINNTNSTNATNNINNYNSNPNNNANSNSKNIHNYNNKHKQKHNILYNCNYTKNINNDYNKIISKIINKNNSNSSKVLKHRTNNNSPMKSKINQCISKSNKKIQNICLSPQNKEELIKINKASNKYNNYYNNFIGSLNDLKNFGIDDSNKILIHSERNKNSKIIFK